METVSWFLRKKTVEKVHAGHQCIERCQLRVKYSVWWPGVTKQMTEIIQQCPVCSKDAAPRKEIWWYLHCQTTFGKWLVLIYFSSRELLICWWWITSQSILRLLDFAQSVESYGFQHLTSSPNYSQSRGQAKRTVQTVKWAAKASQWSLPCASEL